MADLRRSLSRPTLRRFVPSLLVATLMPLLSGCVQPTVRPIVGPSGDPTLFISCADTGQCYELAGRSCPNGYDIQRARGATLESYLVHCRAQPAPEPPVYYSQPAPAYAQPAPQQAWARQPAPQPWAQSAPPPPPAPDSAQSAAAGPAPNAMSMPRPIGSSEFDLGY